MKIERRKYKEGYYRDLKPGDVFEPNTGRAEESIYMVMSRKDDEGDYLCVDLETGEENVFTKGSGIRIIPARVVIGGEEE